MGIRTPISYYGGKQQLASRILGMIPEHQVYGEPFCGGAAIFFAKEASKGEIINFYEVLKRDFPALEREIEMSLHSRQQHRRAWVIYGNPDMFDRVKRAWAVWMLANGSYGCKLNGSFGYDRTGGNSKKLANKRSDFKTDYALRLQKVQLECCDALRIIRSRDTPETFFYLDPPSVGADQGHYDGYTQMDFDALLGLLETIQGKFLVSSFRNTGLREMTRKQGWNTVEVRRSSSMMHGNGKICPQNPLALNAFNHKLACVVARFHINKARVMVDAINAIGRNFPQFFQGGSHGQAPFAAAFSACIHYRHS